GGVDVAGETRELESRIGISGRRRDLFDPDRHSIGRAAGAGVGQGEDRDRVRGDRGDVLRALCRSLELALSRCGRTRGRSRCGEGAAGGSEESRSTSRSERGGAADTSLLQVAIPAGEPGGGLGGGWGEGWILLPAHST